MRFLIAVAFVAVTSSAQAQSVVGTAVVDGNVVDLYSDQTWRARDNSANRCDQIAANLEFCNHVKRWARLKSPSAEIEAQYRYDDRHYGQFVVEEVGVQDGLTAEFMRNVVIENAADATGVDASEIIVFDVRNDTLQGKPYETILYGGNIDGLNVVFFNTIVTSPSWTGQIITFSIGSSPTDEHDAVHASFLSGTKLKSVQ